MQDVSITVAVDVNVIEDVNVDVDVDVVDPTVYISVDSIVYVVVDVNADADADVNSPDVVAVVDPSVYVTVPVAYVQDIDCTSMAGVSSKSSCTAKSFSLSMGISPSWPGSSSYTVPEFALMSIGDWATPVKQVGMVDAAET